MDELKLELEIDTTEYGTGAVDEAASVCLSCKHFFVEEESDGWEYPSYLVPCCNARDVTGYLLWEDAIDGWPFDQCDYHEEKKT